MVAGMTEELSIPYCPVHLLAHSQSSTFDVSLTRVVPYCFRPSSLNFPWFIRPRYFPQYEFFSSSHDMTLPTQSSLRDLFEACAALVVPRMFSFLILSLRVTPHINCSILISFTSNWTAILLMLAKTVLLFRRSNRPVTISDNLCANLGAQVLKGLRH